MKSLKSLKKAAFVGVSSMALVLGMLAAPAAFANENGRNGDNRGGDSRSERSDRRSDRGDRRGDRSDRRGDRGEERGSDRDWNGEMGQ